MSWQARRPSWASGSSSSAASAWYERSRPTARLVALVAALAALAVAGRLVLAPIPNVVATTDIALITGYALGAAPGFAVGALAAPISNFWLGQGPWTAWQMAGWGLVGLGGALARRAHPPPARPARARRRPARLAGLAYGALLDLSVMVTYGGEQSLDRYLALSARGLPFNVAHAAGNFAIALAAGPALVRMISRFRTRLEFSWRPARRVPAARSRSCVAAVLAGASGRGLARRRPARRSAGCARAQSDDGGFAATRGPAVEPGDDRLGDARARGGGPQPARPRAGRRDAGLLPARPGRPAALGRRPRAHDPRARRRRPRSRAAFAGDDLVAELRDQRDGDGSVDGQVNLTAFYVLAMRAAGADLGVARAPGGVAARGPEPRRRLGHPAGGAQRGRLDRRRAAGRWSPPGRAAARRPSAGPRWLRRPSRRRRRLRARPAAASSTPSRPPGRSRAWSRPARRRRGRRARSATSLGCRRPTATTATRRRATRRRSGSPRQACSRSSARRSRSRRCARTVKPARGAEGRVLVSLSRPARPRDCVGHRGTAASGA